MKLIFLAELVAGYAGIILLCFGVRSFFRKNVTMGLRYTAIGVCLLVIVALTPIVRKCGSCCRYVDQMGKSRVEIHGKRAYRDSAGNIVCEIEINKRSLNHYTSIAPLGKRYVILNAPYGERAVRMAISGRTIHAYKGKRNTEIDARGYSMPTNEQLRQEATGWYIHPPDLSNEINNPTLPEYLQTTVLHCYPYSGGPYGSEVPFELDGTNYLVDIEIGQVADSKSICQERWVYLSKILFVPAVIADLLTSPFQIVRFIRQMAWHE